MKPLDLDVVKSVIDKALQSQALSQKAKSMILEEQEEYSLVNLVGKARPCRPHTG